MDTLYNRFEMFYGRPKLSFNKGRGALSNSAGRFEMRSQISLDDGVSNNSDRSRVNTIVSSETSRNIISYNSSPDLYFDRSINPYRGCEHGCIYCYARPTHSYLGHSAGLDFETKLYFKENAVTILKGELSRPGYKVRPIVLGANTDPYQPIEKEKRITRKILEILNSTNHPVYIVTKSKSVLRDLDILKSMASRNLCKVSISLTSLSKSLARILEPRASRPDLRVNAIQALASEKVPTQVLIAPIIPAINDHEIEAILREAFKAGAYDARYVLLRLPWEVKDLFIEWLGQHFPDRKNKVIKLVRQSRGGDLYNHRWGERQRGTGVYAKLIFDRFKTERNRLRLCDKLDELDCSKFISPDNFSKQLKLW